MVEKFSCWLIIAPLIEKQISEGLKNIELFFLPYNTTSKF
jgi:hypothetical protein